MQASMSDQLRAVLNQWEEGERTVQPPDPTPATEAPAPEAPPPGFFQITNNLSRATFQEVNSSPGTRKQITARLLAKGYKIGSVSSIIGQMIKQGVVQVDDEWVLHVTVPEYVPLKGHKTLMRMKKKATPKKPTVVISRKKVEVKRPVSSSVGAGLTALVPVPTPAPTPFNAEQAAQKVLESLTVLQAKALFNELKKIFGDAK